MLLAGLLVAGLGMFAVTSPAAASPVSASSRIATTQGPWMLVAAGTYGKCLDVTGVSYANGAQLQVYDCITQYHQWNQIFYIYAVWGSPYYNIVAGHSGKCLDVTGVSTADYVPIQQYDCLGAGQANQMFEVIEQSGGRTLILASHSGKPFRAGGAYNGAPVYQLNNFSNTSTWYLSQVWV